MLCILLGVLALHLLVFILLIVSTASNEKGHSDLWYSCLSEPKAYSCSQASNEDWIQAVQALMILAVVFCFVSLLAFAYQLFRLFKGGRFYFTSIFQILASVFVMCAAIIYTVMRPSNGKGFGYSYVLAWVAFPLSLISGLIYLILRKKD
uniref:Peripheral myelin protein 22a n=1 Tax=Poecilia reticulata TaxID=8081 RepID=A0A3P9N6T8_POERE